LINSLQLVELEIGSKGSAELTGWVSGEMRGTNLQRLAPAAEVATSIAIDVDEEARK